MAANTYDPLEVFPLPVWECILEKLKKQGSPHDVLNFSKVCTEFQRILGPMEKWLFGSICPFIFPYLKGGELLGCRRICKNWRRGVDSFLEEFETWRPFNEGTTDLSRSSEYDPLQERGIKWTRFKNVRAVGSFLEGMKKHEMKTPFVGRSLSLEGWMFVTGSEFFGKILELLSLYGDLIWHFRVRLQDYCQFYEILRKTPNLKSLILEFSPKFLSTLKNPLEVYSPLEISSLETLEIRSSSTPPVAILEKLMSMINLENLKCLKLHHACSNHVKPYSVVTPFQHLTEVHFSGIHLEDFKHLFNNMISPTSPLGKLSLHFAAEHEIDFDPVCEIINRWKGTLRMLAILVDPSKSELDVSNLKSLEVDGPIYETLILPPVLTASLEYLHLHYYDCHGFYKMDFYDCVFDWPRAELFYSSIWGEMKKLKVIRAQRPSCGFEDYKDYNQKVAYTREMHEFRISH